ncbi:hypothetical protein [Klebsiella pneumoniae]|uniref:hypothetical protein n=1 Tax=Klebsiella pneumoniae TaxID=573 RepID=UPI001CA470BA|nr:hypothetical protein [Klebsiella pneumoniae]MBW5916542.1 hypothetical protein [Klebsiella pneumoniae]
MENNLVLYVNSDISHLDVNKYFFSCVSKGRLTEFLDAINYNHPLNKHGYINYADNQKPLLITNDIMDFITSNKLLPLSDYENTIYDDYLNSMDFFSNKMKYEKDFLYNEIQFSYNLEFFKIIALAHREKNKSYSYLHRGTVFNKVNNDELTKFYLRFLHDENINSTYGAGDTALFFSIYPLLTAELIKAGCNPHHLNAERHNALQNALYARLNRGKKIFSPGSITDQEKDCMKILLDHNVQYEGFGINFSSYPKDIQDYIIFKIVGEYPTHDKKNKSISKRI